MTPIMSAILKLFNINISTTIIDNYIAIFVHTFKFDGLRCFLLWLYTQCVVNTLKQQCFLYIMLSVSPIGVILYDICIPTPFVLNPSSNCGMVSSVLMISILFASTVIGWFVNLYISASDILS